MNLDANSFREAVTNWFSTLWIGVRAALSTAAEPDHASAGTDCDVDPDFEGWVRNDPMVTGNPAGRYRSQPPGYLTSNGRGSLEIGAAED